MKYSFPYFAALICAFLIIRLIVRHIKKKKALRNRRMPYRVDSYSSLTTQSQPSRPVRRPVQQTATGRMPRRTDDREYMTYRNCPDCHSENRLNNQVIFKTAPHEFECRVCGKKFKF